MKWTLLTVIQKNRIIYGKLNTIFKGNHEWQTLDEKFGLYWKHIYLAWKEANEAGENKFKPYVWWIKPHYVYGRPVKILPVSTTRNHFDFTRCHNPGVLHFSIPKVGPLLTERNWRLAWKVNNYCLCRTLQLTNFFYSFSVVKH